MKAICFIVMLLLVLLVSSVSAQGLPELPKVLNIGTYCDITIAMWQVNNEVMTEKISTLDSLYQMPEEFFAAEKVLNDQLQSWQDSTMAEYSTSIGQHLSFGTDNKEDINKFLQVSGKQAVLDSLYQVQDDLYLTFQTRRKGYNIDSSE